MAFLVLCELCPLGVRIPVTLIKSRCNSRVPDECNSLVLKLGVIYVSQMGVICVFDLHVLDGCSLTTHPGKVPVQCLCVHI